VTVEATQSRYSPVTYLGDSVRAGIPDQFDGRVVMIGLSGTAALAVLTQTLIWAARRDVSSI
jgi:hypothetical protein